MGRLLSIDILDGRALHSLTQLHDAIQPKKVVPIHTFEPKQFIKHFYSNKADYAAEIHDDNEEFEV